MKKFLIAGSSLATVAAAGSAGAVDITLGGSIDMGVEFGVGKEKNSMSIGDAYNSISLSIAAAGTTDAGMKYGASFSMATSAELSLDAYDTNGAAAGGKHLVEMTVEGATDIEAAAYNVSGGKMIDAAEIVGVKINSDWMSVGDTQKDYTLAVSSMNGNDICKLAGIVQQSLVDSGVQLGAGTKISRGPVYANGAGTAGEGTRMIGVGVGEYLAPQAVGVSPAGGTLQIAVTAGVGVTAAANAESINVHGIDDMLTANGGAQDALTVDKVYMGPFMSVKMQSSSTKMVVGAVCVEGVDNSATNYFMDVASKVLTASDATVFIEGGFGKITVQTGDYAGGVSAIGDAGDAADLDVEGLAVIVEGVGLLGANPFLAVDLAPTTADGASNLTNLEILTGGTIDLGGLSAAVDVSLLSDDVLEIGSWDLGLDYTMGDMAVAFAYDSTNAWGMSASMDVAGFGVDATIYNKAADAHEKNGLFYSLAASTSLNGVGLSLGVDQDLQPTLSLSKSMGGLSLYAGYDAADQGGKVGATLSF